MKTIGKIIIAILLTCNFAKAQDTMYIYKSGVVITKYAVADIDSVIFYKANTTPVTGSTLTGTWNTTMTFSNDPTNPFNGTTVIVQHDNGSLTGSFVFSDGSGYTLLLSSSNISGNSVTIDWMLESFLMSFQGTVNSAFNYMSGSFYGNGIVMGTWYASKTAKKSTTINKGISDNSEKDRFIIKLSK